MIDGLEEKGGETAAEHAARRFPAHTWLATDADRSFPLRAGVTEKAQRIGIPRMRRQDEPVARDDLILPPGAPPEGEPVHAEDGVDLTPIRWMLSLTSEERLRGPPGRHRGRARGPAPVDFRAVLTALGPGGVRYLLVGGVAAVRSYAGLPNTSWADRSLR